MTRAILIAALLPAALAAADFWESKPFADWNDKELQQVVSKSPWAQRVDATFTVTPGQGRGRDSAPPIVDASSEGSPPGAGKGGGRRSAEDRAPDGSDFQAIPVMIRWLTALPLRQAQMRGKYGKEAATSAEAQKYLAQTPTLYMLSVSGLSGLMVSSRAGDQAKQQIAGATTLSAKSKTPLRPTAIEFVPNGASVDVLLGFPRDQPFAVEDQEIELVTKIGSASIRHKFKLKDLVFHGKLEL